MRIHSFRERLLDWYARAKRDLPWRRNRDPYAVWISEIMLQQTRVAATIPYYEGFLTRFPDFGSLAASAEADLLAQWSGLGYYYRARNMQKAARRMVEAGAFPSTYETIRQLPGVGDYTAAAIASISFSLPHAVVDGNVLRVLSRMENDATDIGSAAGKKRFATIAGRLLDRAQPGEYNQALMELGATICLPRNPQCLVCPISEFCEARARGTHNDLPVRRKARKNEAEHRTLYWIEQNGYVLAWQRSAKETLMPGFWELPEPEQLPSAVLREKVGAFRHTITFHDYRFTVHQAEVPENLGVCRWIEQAAAARLPVSSIFRKAWQLVKNKEKALTAAVLR
ncbi:MAG: A/G-specific adenine glycosylase [Bryobacteraceae bacterium]